MHKVINSDCLAHMKSMADNSVDSIVTDPPYEIGMMGKAAVKEGFNFIGTELSPEYAKVAEQRIEFEEQLKKTHLF